MNNVVLKSLMVENFASFAEKTIFTTKSEISKKEYLENTFDAQDDMFNKVSFVYGANGSGKTYFCKIIREIQRILDFSPLIATNSSQILSLQPFKNLDVPVASFAFDTSYKTRPSKFGIELIIEDVLYNYEFMVQERKIIHEVLTKKIKRTEKLIERTSPSYKDINLFAELKSFEQTKHVVKEEALCLPLAALLNNELASKIINAIKSIQAVNMTTAKLQPKEGKYTFSEERLAKYINILKKADPTIRNIKVSFTEEEVSHQKIDADDFENRELITKKMTVGVKSEHAVFDKGTEMLDAPIDFFAEESLGTIKLFTALPYLFDVLESGSVLIIDELENGLHLSLAKEIVNLFTNSDTNPKNAQLICTSHQPLLLNGQFRRDQVWVVNKDGYGKSALHRLSSLKTSRTKINLANRIIEGAFNCNPDLFFENNT